MLLVLAFDIVQHSERLFKDGCPDHNLLETAFERSVGFDILRNSRSVVARCTATRPGKYRSPGYRRVERALQRPAPTIV